MVKEAKHWREQSDLQMVAFTTARESQMGEAGALDNFVPETFDINLWLKSANLYDNRGFQVLFEQTNRQTKATLPVSVLCVIQGSFFCRCALSQDLCVYIMPCRCAPICKKNITMSFNHLHNILMSLKDFDSRCMLLSNITQSQ